MNIIEKSLWLDEKWFQAMINFFNNGHYKLIIREALLVLPHFYIYILFFSMIAYIAAIIALASVADATFVLGTTAAKVGTTAATTGTAFTITSASATSLALLGGVAILKGVVLAAALARSRGKRSAEEENDAVYAILAAQEPIQCYRRLICDLSAGAIPDNNKLTTLFNGDVSPVSAKFEFATAAKVGKIVKSAQLCEVRYSCPLSTNEIQKLFN